MNNPSLKPRRGRSWKRARRIAIVAELEARFIPDAEIANHLGITVQALHHIKITPEFLARRLQLSQNVLSVYEQSRLATDEARAQELSELVPSALNAVRNVLLDRSHPHHARVALDILDRTKATSKISRTEHSVAPVIDSSAQNKRAQELLSLLGAPAEEKIVVEAVVPSSIEIEDPDEDEDSQINKVIN